MRSYRDFVTSQSLRNPCLANLCQFLDTQTKDSASNHVCIEFLPGQSSPQHRQVKIQDLPQFCHDARTGDGSVQGRVLLVEDLDTTTIEILGSYFDLNPIFFASHIHAPHWENAFQTPEVATLPSRLKPQTFVNIHYHRSVVLHGDLQATEKLTTSSNVRRKVSIISNSETWPFNRGGKVALIQQCCSIYVRTLPNQTWLGMYTTQLTPGLSSD